MAEKRLNKCSALLFIREIQIKLTLRFHLIPIRITKFKNSGENMFVRMWKRGTFLHFWLDCKVVKTLQESIWKFLRKLEKDIPEYPAVPLLSIYLYVVLPQDHVFYYVHIILICDIHKLSITQISHNRMMNTENVVYLHSGILLSY